MPAPASKPTGQTTKGLLSGMGAALGKAAKEHAKDAVKTTGIQELPPNIKNGVAKITSFKYAKYKPDAKGGLAGKPYAMVMARIVEPTHVEWDGRQRKVEGRMTKQGPLPMCETKTKAGVVTSMADNVAKVTNLMKQLMGEDFCLELTTIPDEQVGAWLEAAAQAIEKEAPHFEFSTSLRKGQVYEGKQQPDGVWENWGEVIPDYQQQVGEAFNDGTGPSANGTGHSEAASTEEAPADPEYSDDQDLDSLAAAADGEPSDEAAAEKIKELALGAGVDEDAIKSAQNWTAVVELMKGGAAEETPAEEPFKPEKGNVYGYKVIDPKTKKPATDPKSKKEKAPVDCEVLAVYPKNETVDLKNTVNNQIIKAVKWSDLIVS